MCATCLCGSLSPIFAADVANLEIVQQSKRIKGTVVDVNGETVIGANVVQKGTSNGTITDMDGNFELNVPTGAVLSISFIGYRTQEITVKANDTDLKIVLKDDF